MNRETLQGQRDYFRMVHGITLRLIGTFSDEDLSFRPRPEMRTVRELILHIYGMERVMAENLRHGRIPQEAEDLALPEKEAARPGLARLSSTAAAQQFAEECHQAADDALAAMTDEELARPVEAPYGSFPAWQFFNFAYDEHLHHRGQLYTYMRLLGKEPPMLYDYH